MAVTKFESVVSAQSLGSADVQTLATAFAGLEGAIDRASKKGDALNEHKGFGEFAEKVKRGIENPMQAAGEAAEGLIKSMGPVGAGVAATVGVFGTASVVAFEAAKALGEYGTEVQNAATRTGLAVKEVGLFSFAAKLFGQDIGVVEAASRKLSQGLADNTEDGKKSREMLKHLGIEARTTTGEMRPMADIFVQISEALNEIGDTPNRNAAGLAIFGRSWIEMAPTMLHLAEGLAAAEKAGIAPNAETIRQMEELHKQSVLLEAQWAKMKRQVELPVAGTFSFGIKFLGKAYDDMSVVPAFLQQLIFGGRLKADDVTMLETEGWGSGTAVSPGVFLGGGSMSRSAHGREMAAIQRNDEAIEAALLGTSEEQLARAKQKLEADRAKLKTGVMPSVNEQTFRDIADDRREVARIEARIEAEKKAKQELEQFDKAIAEFHKQSTETELSSGEKILRKRDELIAQAEKLGKAEAVIVQIRADAASVIAAQLDKAMQEFEKFDLGVASKYQSSVDRREQMFGKGGILNPFFGMQDAVDAFKKDQEAQRQIDTLVAQSQRGEITARANRSLRMQELALGPGHEADAIAAGYQARLDLAQKLYDVDITRASQEKEMATQRVDMARALVDLDKERYEADIERELRLAELEQQRIERWRAIAIGGFHALLSGDVGGFLKQQGMGLADRVVGNAAGMAWDTVSKITPHASQGSLLGNLLAGSSFGPDPMKVAGVRLEGAGERLHVAAADLMAAARSLAMSRSGGGGLFSPVGGTYAALARASGGYINENGDDLSTALGDFDSLHPNGYYAPTGGVGFTPLEPHFDLSRGLGIGSAALASGIGIYSGIQQGGARGIAAGIGGVLSGAGAIMALASKTLSWAGPVGAIAGMALSFLPALLGDPKRDRVIAEDQTIAAARYIPPTSSTYTVDRYGRSYDSDMAGSIRPILVQVQMPVSAMDGRDVIDRGPVLAESLAIALESRLAPRLANAVRNTAFPR